MLQHGFRGKSVPSVHGKFALLTPIGRNGSAESVGGTFPG
jgi:hypothetical protein